MKKPTNKIAMLLWILTILGLVCDVAGYITAHEALEAAKAALRVHLPANEMVYVVEHKWIGFQASILATALLAGLGILIEYVDQIRWNALHLRK